MPGIAGIVYPESTPAGSLVKPMLDTLEHRGDKSRDLVVFKNMEIGIQGGKLTRFHNRIAALDGHLYRTESLRKFLQEKGYPALTASDTELILYAYDVWESSFLEHLEGDFAFFLLDEKNDKLILARDRIGKKPLYWYHDQNHFVFASEIKSILKSGIVPQTLAKDAFAYYLYFGFIPQDMSPVQKVNKLLPSYALHFYHSHYKTIIPYWSYSEHFLHRKKESTETILSNVNELLEESVKMRIPDQKAFGCFLSGGLGSASTAYYLKKLAKGKEINSYSVVFQDETEQDLFAAKDVAKHLAMTHQYEIVTPTNCCDQLLKIFWYLDEPLADPNSIAVWKLATLAASSKVIFSGMGSDELFAGHNRYTVTERKRNYLYWALAPLIPILKHIFLPLLLHISQRSTFKILQQIRTNPWQLDYLNQNALFTDTIRNQAAPEVAHLFDPHVFLHKFHHLSRISSPVASFLYFDVKTRLPDSYILQYERLLTAQNITWNTPFLDRNLIEYLAGFPEPEELQEQETFFILKTLLKDSLPPSFLNRPKKTRRSFLSSWVDTADFSKYFDMLLHGTLVESGLISKKWLLEQLKSTESKRKAFPYLWAILAYEVWIKMFIHNKIDTKPPTISMEDFLNG